MFKSILLSFLLVISTGLLYGQVGINTTTPADGAILDVNSSNKGFLMTRVILESNTDTITITPRATPGLMVYNTVNAGTGPERVTPGIYYWSGATWRRLYNEGYTLQFNQSTLKGASTDPTVYSNLPGLNAPGLIFPFSGTYQIIVVGYLAAGPRLSGNDGDGASQGSISISMKVGSGAFTILKEAYVTSSSKSVAGFPFNSLAQSVTIIYNVDIEAGEVYHFKVRGREWFANQVLPGWYGNNTNTYTGANSVNDAQRGTMTITLIRQQ